LNVECPVSYENVSVLELLDALRIDEPPRSAAKELRTVRIFLASSSELREDRDEFDLHFRQQNDRLRKEGLYLEIVRWEYFLDAMSETRLQDEYNKKIRECEIFVCLFFTKTGKFTEEEFGVALRQFKDTGKPRIYTYFNGAAITPSSERRKDLNSLWDFEEKLKALGHFPTVYNNIEQLKNHFRDQLDRLLEE
jgi:internalin A